MSGNDQRTAQLLAEGRQLLRDGKVGKALDRAYAVWNYGEKSSFAALKELLEEMRPSVVGKRDQQPFDHLYNSVARNLVVEAPNLATESPASPATGDSGSDPGKTTEMRPAPTSYSMPVRQARPAVDTLAAVFVIAAILSIIGGVVVGISVSHSYSLDANGNLVKTHDGGVIFGWIVAGLLGAALWWTIAVALRLLAEIADNTKRSP